jgi:mersacidin/lichenicidin family type 2 lantibiotic
MTATTDLVRAWKDEDYREEMGLDLADHPAGTIDLSALQTIEADVTTSGDICDSLALSCFTDLCPIRTLLNCFEELADSRF